MSKILRPPYVPHDNNPEKKVPAKIIEDFFLALKTADINKVREYVDKEKVKLSYMTDAKTGETPFHVVLKMDNKTADKITKLNLLKYLATNGSPLDIPDKSNVRAIHLASQLQDEDIIDFMLKKKLDPSRTDSSNNTALHYATKGLEVKCPGLPVNPGSIVPSQRVDQIEFSTTIKDANKFIMKLLAEQDPINKSVIHFINTIMRIPQMYKNSSDPAKKEKLKEIQTALIEIFASVASDPTYAGGLTRQQAEIDHLVTKFINEFQQELLPDVMKSMAKDIKANNTGWGPKIGIATGPTDIDRILPTERIEEVTELKKQLDEEKEVISSRKDIKPDQMITAMSDEIDKLYKYEEELIFGGDQTKIYGSDLTRRKIFFLLMYRYLMVNHKEIFVDRIMNNANFMSANQFTQYMRDKPIPNESMNGYIYSLDMVDILTGVGLNDVLEDLLRDIRNNGIARVDRVFDEFIHADLENEISPAYLRNTSLDNLVKNPEFKDFTKEYEEVKKRGLGDINDTWADLLIRILYRWINDFGNFISLTIKDPQVMDNMKYEDVNLENFPDIGGISLLTAIKERFTYLDIFRILDFAHSMIKNNSIGFDMNSYPAIFDDTNYSIGTWLDYINDAYTATEKLDNLELIFVEKIFYRVAQLEIKKVLEQVYDRIFQDISQYDVPGPNNDIRDIILERRDLFKQNHMYALILPPYVDSDDSKLANWTDIIFESTNKFDALYNKIVEPDSEFNETVVQFFSDFFNSNVSTDNFVDIKDEINDLDTTINPELQIINDRILQNDLYKSFVNELLNKLNIKTNYKNFVLDPTIEIEHGYEWGTLGSFTIHDDMAETYIDNNNLSNFNYVIELISYYFTRMIRRFLTFGGHSQNINIIISDIIFHIRDEYTSTKKPRQHEYFIPQIMLPVLIEQSIHMANEFKIITLYVTEYNKIFTEHIIHQVNITDKNQNDTMILLNEFNTKVQTIIDTAYQQVIQLFKYHNSVIDYLNKLSASKIVINLNTKVPPDPIMKIFSTVLSKIDVPPDKITDLINFVEILKNYKIPQILYYAGPRPFFVEEKIYTYSAVSLTERYATTYRNIMNIRRLYPPLGTNSTMGLNSQSVVYYDSPTYYINGKPPAIEGEWLGFPSPNLPIIQFKDAFIKWKKINYIIPQLSSAPDIIFPYIGPHLKLQKQRIIELVVQHIVDTQLTTSKDIYDKLKILANEHTFDKVPDVKIYCVVAQLVDNIIINLTDYAIKQSVHNWIYDEIQSVADYKGLVAGPIVNIIQKKDYMKLSPGDIETKLVSDMMVAHNKYIQFQIPPVESNPSDLTYFASQRKESAKPERNDKLISYLYNINYLAPDSDNTGNTSQCFIINPAIVSKLITSGNLNKQNSDGQTPLHYAVQMLNPDIVEILMKRGALQFKNFNQQTPKDLALNGLMQNINLIPTIKVSDFVGNFATPFNDLMIARLSEEKWKNNIIRGIKFGIPVQLCIIQHMYHTYVQNYRIGISPDLKNKLTDLFKRHNIGPIYTYPVDLFEVNNQDMYKLLSYADFNYSIKSSVIGINKRKMNSLQKQIDFIDFQLDGLKKERDGLATVVPPDTNKINVIDSARNALTTRKGDLESKFKALKILPDSSNPTIDDGFIGAYIGSLTKLKKRVEDRTWSICKFYNESFSLIGRSNAMYLAIWQNYMDKTIPNAPSMIFLSLHRIIRSTLQNTDVKIIKTDLQTVEAFLSCVKEFIDQRVDLPRDLDNPILIEEREQIIYLLNLFITEHAIQMIYQQVDKALREMDGSGNLYVNTESVMNQMYATEYNGATIESYMKEILPNLIYKFLTQTYGQNDPAKKITMLTEIFDPIVSILQANTIVVFDSESILIRNIKEYLIPFLSETYQNFVHHLRLSTYGFERYIINLYQLIKIYRSML